MNRSRHLIGPSVLLIAALVACSGRDTARPAPADPGAILVTIPIHGMVCMSCVATVKRTLAHLDGVDAVDVNLAPGEAHVRYHADRVSPAQLVAAINDLGYRATLPNAGRP